ncbi:MAG: universal stress protein [Acaryochloridaceae cyanobacterium SU_2_1]|nr:universal stress protein [Acaryochloridaceae cyanobacterium SU_2_1]
MTFARILVALDQSELRETIFLRSLTFAQACQGSLHLLHVLSPSFLGDPGFSSASTTFSDLGTYPTFVDPTIWQQQNQAQTEQAAAWLGQYCQTALDQGIEASFSYPTGEAGHEICQAATDWSADLVVVGRRGRSGLAEAIMGSVSQSVLHHAPCDVLVIQSLEIAAAPLQQSESEGD